MIEMEDIYIPQERLQILKKDTKMQGVVERTCNCKIEIVGNEFVRVSGGAFSEFVAKNVIFAFGRGFEMPIALLLADENYYFSSIDLKEALGTEKRITRIKARVIGVEGKTKRYIEGVSSARIMVYGHTISFIGNTDEIKEAETAVDTLIAGGTHKLAYLKMEAAHRKNKERARFAKF
jgi:ribosomal RNA assembly protein